MKTYSPRQPSFLPPKKECRSGFTLANGNLNSGYLRHQYFSAKICEETVRFISRETRPPAICAHPHSPTLYPWRSLPDLTIMATPAGFNDEKTEPEKSKSSEVTTEGISYETENTPEHEVTDHASESVADRLWIFELIAWFALCNGTYCNCNHPWCHPEQTRPVLDSTCQRY
jgi:hypothetical protein